MREKNGAVSLTLGIDLGGTKVETSLVNPTGCVIASHRSPPLQSNLAPSG